MATLTKGQTFGVTEQVTNTKLHNLIDNGTVTAIVNADVDGAAAIVDTKLAQITTAAKVSGQAITLLTSLPSGAGAIPLVNLPTIYNSFIITSLASIQAINTSSFKLGSTITNINSSVTLASLANTVSSDSKIKEYIDANPEKDSGNIIFQYIGSHIAQGTSEGEYTGSALDPQNQTGNYRFFQTDDTSAKTVMKTKWVKLAGVDTVTFYAYIWNQSAETTTLTVDVGGQSSTATHNSSTPTEKSNTIDVSGLFDGTPYDIQIKIHTSNAINEAYVGTIVLLGS